MTTATIWQAAPARLTDPVPDPSDVGPGWVAFVVFVLLFVVTILLWLNMKKQLGRIRLPEDEAQEQPTEQPTGRPEEGAEEPAPQDGDASRPQPPPG
jgi:flagellar biosynthesis/type III secretory pathway M-ring protein FliF/YscJ